MEKGKGAYVWDKEGKKYLDFLSGIAVNALGHGHPVLLQALKNQLEKLTHISNYYYHESAIKLAEMIVEKAFLGKVFYCNSGTEANEAAIKLARKYGQNKGKTEIITTLNSFHGRTLGSLAATGQVKYQTSFQPLPSGFTYVTFNDLAAVEKALNEKTCAIMLEPIQGESGIHPATREYLQGLRKICEQNDLLLILDEVQTGVGRTGKMFAYQHYGITPDIMTMAKALGGGIPIGAMLVGEKYAHVLQPGDHGTTFGGNPLACTAALATMEIILQEDLCAKAAELGFYLQEKLLELEEVKEVRGKGLMLALELTKLNSKEVVEKSLGNGLLLNAIGEHTVRLLPPLIINKEDIDQMIDILSKTIAQMKGEK